MFPNTLLWGLLKQYIVRGIELLGMGHIFWGKVDRAVHDEYAELEEECALEGFCEEIRYHIFGGAVSRFDPTLFDLVGDVKMFDVEMACALAGGLLPVDFQSLCRLIVLV